MHYDLEVSGFPSSHAGHLVLLGLKDQDYPGTRRIEDWPTWTLPILQWGARQGAVTGFAHSGWGLQVTDDVVPSLQVPAFDGIGANEYIVDVTHDGAVDFISAADTPYPWELSIWYHTLNVGFRTRISGETDFPCITDDRVGRGRTYARMPALSYAGLLDAIRRGATYVSDGRAHLMDFAVNGLAVGDGRRNHPGERAVRRSRSRSPSPRISRTCPGATRRSRTRRWAVSSAPTTSPPIVRSRSGPSIRRRTGTWSARASGALAACRWS